MNKRLIIISVVLAMLASVLGLVSSIKPVQAAGVGTIYAAVTDENHISTAPDGSTGTFTVQIMVDGGTASYNVATAYLTWDPAALALDSITALPSVATSDFTTSFQATSGSGYANISRGKTGSPLTGITKLVQLTFHHIAASAATNLVIDNTKSHIIEYDTLNELLNPTTGTPTIATYHTQWTVTVQVNGTVSVNPARTFTGTTNHTGVNYVVHNSSFAVTYTPETGAYVSHVSALTDGGISKSFTATGGTYTNATVTATSTIIVTFAPNTFTITTSVAAASGTIAASQTVNYGATNIGFLMTANTGYYIQKYAVDSVDSTTGVGVRDSSYSYTYTFAGPITANHTLAVYFTIRVFNINLSVGANGTMTGALTVNYGGSANYTVQGAGTAATANYEIASLTDSISGADAGAVGLGEGAGVYNSSGAYTYSLTNVTADHTITSLYQRIDLTPGAATGSNGTTTLSYPQASYLYSGDTLTITLAPAAGYFVSSLTNNGTAVVAGTVGNSTTTITTGSGIPGARNETLVITITNIQRKPLIAVTYQGTYSVTVVITGTVSSNPNKTFTGITNHTGINYVIDGATFAITYTPDADANTSSIVDSVAGSQVPVAAGGTYTTSAITANRTVTITYAPKTYTITSSASSNGTITGTMTVNQGATNLDFVMNANAGYYITTYSINGTPSTTGVNNRDTSNTYTYTFVGPITANQTISVTYSIKVYNITLTVGANGTMTGVGTANWGTSPSYVIRGDGTATTANYEIASLTDNGIAVPAAVGLGEGAGVVPSSGAYTYTISNITTDHTLISAYTKIVLTPGVGGITDSTGGTTTVSPTTLYSGDTITLTLNPDTGYHVVGLTNNGVAVVPGTSGNSTTTISALLPADTDALRDVTVTVTITNIQTQPNFVITYAKNTYHLTLINQGAAADPLNHVPATGALGSGTLNTTITLGTQAVVNKLYQDTQSIPFAPAAGSYIYDLQLDGTSLDATGTPHSKKLTFGLATFRSGSSYNFASIAGDHTLRAIYEKLGDVNLNGVVDIVDAAALSSKWNTSDATSYYVIDRANSDFNADNISNEFDASLIMQYWS